MRVIAIAILALSFASSANAQQSCESAGLTLPQGFCATVFADSVSGARHLLVAANGDVFVATSNTRGARGGVVALRDTTRDGKADVRVKFGANGGSGIALRGEKLYFATNDAVLRYDLPRGNLLAGTKPDTIVRGLPSGGHSAKTIALGKDNDLFVNIGSSSNACQAQDRQAGVAGADPCSELDTRAGIWRFDANRKNQTQRDGKRYATGLRNVVALTFGPDGMLYGAQMGRDQLGDWNRYFTAAENAEKPAEIFVRIQRDDDYGWPYCYYDREQQKHMLAPEYGGDGKQQGRCAAIKQPLAAFPGHWAPEAVAFYTGSAFPERYRGAAFITFHGSWNRAPQPQAGYRVVFLPLHDGRAGESQTFATGFTSESAVLPGGAEHRPMGMAVGPDGALYIGDDTAGRIWRVTYGGKLTRP